jgi:hypothetical protein
VVDGVHGLRGGGARRAAPAWRRGDRVTAACGSTVGESIAVVFAELIALDFAHGHACSANGHADRGAERDTGPDSNDSADTGSDDRALAAGAHSGTNADLEAADLVGRRVGRDVRAALLAHLMKPIGVLLELGRRLKGLAAFAALEI